MILRHVEFDRGDSMVDALEKFLGDRYNKDSKWAENLLYRPETDEMDDIEWV